MLRAREAKRPLLGGAEGGPPPAEVGAAGRYPADASSAENPGHGWGDGSSRG